MVVLGQPKTMRRVHPGDQPRRPRPRAAGPGRDDPEHPQAARPLALRAVRRSIHQSFYRSVEATSVTPFSPRALDRGLAGTLVALARQGHAPMTPPKGASGDPPASGTLWISSSMPSPSGPARTRTLRAGGGRGTSAAGPRAGRRPAGRVEQDRPRLPRPGHRLAVQPGRGRRGQAAAPRVPGPGTEDMLPPRHRKFRANRSMRDVEPSVNLWLRTMDNVEIERGGRNMRTSKAKNKNRTARSARARSSRRSARARCSTCRTTRCSSAAWITGPRGTRSIEPRLVDKLKDLLDVAGLEALCAAARPRRPDSPTQTGITAWQFPEWFITQDVEPDGSGDSTRSARADPPHRWPCREASSSTTNKKRRPVVPVRFVRACRRGPHRRHRLVQLRPRRHHRVPAAALDRRAGDQRRSVRGLDPLRVRQGRATDGRGDQAARRMPWAIAMAPGPGSGRTRKEPCGEPEPPADPHGQQRLLPAADERDFAARPGRGR